MAPYFMELGMHNHNLLFYEGWDPCFSTPETRGSMLFDPKRADPCFSPDAAESRAEHSHGAGERGIVVRN